MSNTTDPPPSEADLRRANWFRLACRPGSGKAKAIREATRTSLAETARVAGVSKGYLWHVEAGQKTPGTVNAAKLGRIYQQMEKSLQAASEGWSPPPLPGDEPS